MYKDRREEKREAEGLAKTTDPHSGKSSIRELSQYLRFQRTVSFELRPVNIWEFSGFCSFSILTAYFFFFLDLLMISIAFSTQGP